MSDSTTLTTCKSCSGKLVFNPDAKTLDCPYCNSVFALDGQYITHGSPVLTDTVFKRNADLIIPFDYGKEIFEENALIQLSYGDYVPGDILDSYYPAQTRGFYSVLYHYVMEYSINTPQRVMTFGDEHAYRIGGEGPYYPKMLDWAVAAIAVPERTKPFTEAYTTGFEVFDDTDSEETWKNIARDFAIDFAKKKKGLASEDDITLNSLILTKIYMPFWLNEYTYQNEKFHVLLSGRNRNLSDSTKPVDKAAMEEKPANNWWQIFNSQQSKNQLSAKDRLAEERSKKYRERLDELKGHHGSITN